MLKLETPILLHPTAQNYHWGKKGHNSLVAKLLGDYSETEPYAELWVGEHPRSPSTAIVEEAYQKRTIRLSLRELISRYPRAILGERVLSAFGPDLPFLFKILSIEKPLSIQAHPDRERARQLYKLDPTLYPDANHKPELAVALTKVDFLYGFKDGEKMRDTFKTVPELGKLVSAELAEKVASGTSSKTVPSTLQAIYHAVLRSDKNLHAKLAEELQGRLKIKGNLTSEESLALLIIEDYGLNDLGIFSVFLLNYCSLQPGEAVFVRPNVLHAYLSGELAECMANSDNVVRAGITPKKQDKETLLDMLDFDRQGTPTLVTSAIGVRFPEVISYTTAAEEFAFDSIEGTNISLHLATNSTPTLIFCLEGDADIIGGGAKISALQGQAVLIPAALADFNLEVPKGRVLMVTVP